jgi:hypothetical protein
MLRFAYLLIAGFVLLAHSALAETQIPKMLEDWRGWVLEKHTDINCPILYNAADKNCIWPGSLDIQVNDKSGQFVLRLDTFGEGFVNLPGDKEFWPESVVDTLSGKAIAVRDGEGSPQVFLKAGKYQLEGSWNWEKMPRTLVIPESTGILSLTIDNKKIQSPFLENPGLLLLNANTQQNQLEPQDNLDLRVFRRLQDDVPFKMLTRIEMDISGKERELHLGQALLENFRITAFNSDLPAKLEKDGSLRVQVKSGSWIIEIWSQSQSPVNQITLQAENENRLWPDQEIWVFEQRPEIRNVQISGMSPIDPQQTQLPEDWKYLPAYLAEANVPMQLEELQRGGESAKNQLILSRQMWLDFSGKGFTVKDRISGELHQSWRLESQAPFNLQSAKADGEAQLITQISADANPGIEIRQRRLNLEGISRIETRDALPISGWSSTFNQVSTELILPPGWSLLTATGTSTEYGSWIEKWNLWTLFLVLIISLALARIVHLRVGALALVTLVVIYHRDESPVFTWLNLAAVLALLPYISGKFKTWMLRYAWISFALLALNLLPFCVQQAREFFYPQQEYANKHMKETYYSDDDSWFPFFMSSSSKKDMAYEESYAAENAPVASVMEMDSRMEKSQNSLQKPLMRKKQQYQADQMVQAGPGIPTWSWNSVHLHWNGPVLAEEKTQLYLLSPVWNRLGSLFSVILSLLLAALLFKHFSQINKASDSPTRSSNPAPALTSVTALLLSSLLMMPSEKAMAEPILDKKLLAELETRLTAPAKCLPNCASIESVKLIAEPNQLKLQMQVHAIENLALPLPGQRQEWWPSQILVDGKNASLMQNSQGQLLVFLTPGRHEILLQASVQNRESLDFNFPLAIHNFSSQLNGWQLSGNAQGALNSVQIQRTVSETQVHKNSDEQLRPDPVPPFVIIKRHFNFDLDWNLTTEVIRVAPNEGVINLQVPLLTGEAPIEGNTNLQHLSADKLSLQIQLDKQQGSVYWTSRLAPVDSIQLVAATEQPWVEIWEVEVSDVWHLTHSGIAAVHPQDVNQLPSWQPWPGEALTLNFNKPIAAKGNALVIESVELNSNPSNRATTNRLDLSIRTNQANQFTFTLPESTSLNQISVNGSKLSLSPVKGVLRIPLQPGEQSVNIEWQSTQGISSRFVSPALNLGLASANQSININLPSDRWPLLVGGPSIGPSVLLWGMLLVILLLSYQLGKSKLTPLSSVQWILLSLGVATVTLHGLFLIAVWLLCLQWRQNLKTVASKTRFKWMQFGLFSLSMAALITLLATIPIGLLSSPDMHIKGNGSSAYFLRWYQDMSPDQLAQAWVISLPLWIYKLVMLAWSLWLAASLIRWLAWAWKALGTQGFWYASDIIVTADNKSGSSS